MTKEPAVEGSVVAEKPKTKAYSYIRMSTKEQLEGDSLRRQLEKTRKYANDNGLELVEKFDDIGLSAFHGLNVERGALGRFLDSVEAGDVPRGSHLIIEAMDRLTRQSALRAVGLLTDLIEAGIVVVTLDDRQTYSKDSFGKNQSQLYVAIGAMTTAHEESRRKSMRLSDAWGEKRRKLRADKKVLTSRVPAWLTVDQAKGVVEVIPERAKLVEEIFELACSGYGNYSIARMLNERGEAAWGSPKRTRARPKKTDMKTIWRESYIKKILSNRAVLGEFQPHKVETTNDRKKLRVPDGEVINGYYPQIISPEVFRDASLAMERRKVGGRGRKGAAYANVLSGLLHCDRCRSGMRYIDKGAPPKGGKYLRCSRTVNGGLCISKVYRYEVVEQVVLSALESLDVEKVLGGSSISKRISEKKSEREQARIHIEVIEKKIARYHEAIENDDGDVPASVMESLRTLDRERNEKNEMVRQLDDDIEALLSIDPEKRKAVLDSLLKRIRDESDSDGRAKARRALASELQRMIETMVIRPDVHFAHEIMDADETWQKRYRVGTQSRLERYLDEFGFEISIRFWNGEQRFINGVNQTYWKTKWNSKFNDLRLLAKHAQSTSTKAATTVDVGSGVQPWLLDRDLE